MQAGEEQPSHTDDDDEAGDAAVLAAGPNAAFTMLAVGLNALGALGIVGLMVLINADVLGRALFSAPIRGVPEVVSLSIVSIVFLQAGYMLRSGRMISSDSLITRLRRTTPGLARWMDAAFNTAGALLFGLIFRASLPSFTEAWSNDLFVGAEGDFTVPIWPMKLIVLIGSAMLCLQYAANVLAVLRPHSAWSGRAGAGFE